MEKLLFVGLPEHKRTASFEFFTQLLENTYQIEYTKITIDKNWTNTTYAYNRIIFWQRLPPPEHLRAVSPTSVVYVPMYDEARNYNRQVIRTWAPFKIISFCRSIHEDLTAWGFNSKYVQYFPKPMVEAPLPLAAHKAFFWKREGSYINEAIPDAMIPLLLHDSGMKLHYHSETKPVCEKEFEDMVASRSSWLRSKEEMISLLRECSLYIAPRESEGIGMSFLDAMANGLAVAGADNPTMNEYISDGQNGYLFDLMKPLPINLENLQQVREKSLESCQAGYEKWEKEKWSLIDFIEEPHPSSLLVQVPRGFEYRSLKQKSMSFRAKRLVKRLAGK